MSRVRAIKRLMESVEQDSASIIQQSICYDKNKYWSISVSWGYVVQVWRGIMSPRELEMPSRTFLNWYKRTDYTAYTFNTRPVFKHPCQKPFLFYASKTRYDNSRKQIIGTYFRDKTKPSFCRWKMDSPQKLDTIVVLKRPDPLRWEKVINSLITIYICVCVSRTHILIIYYIYVIDFMDVCFACSHQGGIVVEFCHRVRVQPCTYGWAIVERVRLVSCSMQ